MKKKLFAMIAIFLFSIFIGRVYVDDVVTPGDYFEVYTTYHNTGNSRAEDMHLTVYMPELNMFHRTSTFDLASEDNGGRYVIPYMPAETPSGWYQMWIMLTNDNQRDYAHQWVYVG